MFRSLRSAIALALCACLLAVPARSQPTPSATPPTEPDNPPWPIRVGLRIAELRQKVPTVDRVVLVPDEATFLAAIQQWSLAGRWPILINDDRYTPLFLQRFQPAEVVRLPAVGTPLPAGENLREAMQNAIAPAWNSPDARSLSAVWRRLNWTPPGVVFTWERDTAWPAAVALAADRGQPLKFLEGDFGSPNSDLTDALIWNQLNGGVEQGVEETGYAYSGQGDAIDTVTVVRDLPVRYNNQATTDLLARHPTQKRWAVTGWLFGSSQRALYQAMCAIFLPTESVLLYNSYAAEKEPWITYSTDDAAEFFQAGGLSVRHVKPPEAKRSTWLGLNEPTPFPFDLMLMSSRGPRHIFRVGQGNAALDDIPTLATPTAIHLIHSGSAAAPGDPNTVAGRWLDNGAYAYIGSVREPYLTAFIPPNVMTARLLRGTPFLMAARHYNLEPWRITTIGDPLMILMPPRDRLPPQNVPLR
ncbi:MAG: hypothetical protein AAGB13_12165 [Cyanobacteria bacterium P01_F01_bin.33]